MVGAIKRWLGIKALEKENLQLAKALKSAHRRIGELKDRLDKERRENAEWADSINRDVLEVVNLAKSLTSEAPKPKLVAKPQRANWKAFKEQVERATEPEREEA